MLDHLTERARLTLADCHICDAERRITRQRACLEHCRAAGHDTREAEQLLRALEAELAAWQERRAEIGCTSERLEHTAQCHP
jgi:hypothetical protein